MAAQATCCFRYDVVLCRGCMVADADGYLKRYCSVTKVDLAIKQMRKANLEKPAELEGRYIVRAFKVEAITGKPWEGDPFAFADSGSKPEKSVTRRGIGSACQLLRLRRLKRG